MAFFPETNTYPNEEARRAWFASFSLFVLWWIFRLLTDLFPHHTATATQDAVENGGAAAAAVAATGVHHSRLHRITTALRDGFISSLAVVVLNEKRNFITRKFNILHWIIVWVVFLWAILRAFGRIGHFIGALPVIALFVLLWVYAFVNHSYTGQSRREL
jgi:hypothetical protein